MKSTISWIHILQECLQLEVKTFRWQKEVLPGERFRLMLTATVRSDVPVRWLGVRYPGGPTKRGKRLISSSIKPPTVTCLACCRPAHRLHIRTGWGEGGRTIGLFRVEDPSLIGQPENPPVFPMEQIFEADGEKFTIPDQPVQANNRLALRVIPPVSVPSHGHPRPSRPLRNQFNLCAPSPGYKTTADGAPALQFREDRRGSCSRR